MSLSVFFSTLQRVTEGFWKSVADKVPRKPSEIRILNPYFIQEAAFQFIGLPFNNGLMGKGVRLTVTLSLGDAQVEEGAVSLRCIGSITYTLLVIFYWLWVFT